MRPARLRDARLPRIDHNLPVIPATIAAAVEYESVVRKSRFVARLEPVASVPEADAAIARVRKLRWDANHHCVALVVGPHGDQQRSSDDGEPAGTAGVPMLEVLRQRGMTDLVAVVTRYFGGVLLGAGGLVRAYSSAVSGALDRAAIVRRAYLTQAFADVSHADAGRIDNALREWADVHESLLQAPAYGATVRFQLLVPPDATTALREAFATWTSGVVTPTFGENRLVDVHPRPTG